MNMVMSGNVLMVATPGEDITEIHSTLTIISLHLLHSYIYSWCMNGRVGSTQMACPPSE